MTHSFPTRRASDLAVTDAASVGVQVLLVGAGARIHRLRDPAVQAQARGLVLDAKRVLRELLAQRLAKALTGEQLPVALVAARRLAVVRHAQIDVGASLRQRAQPFLDVAQFGALGAQEIARKRTRINS